MNFGDEGKAAVITGSSKGIGRETAEQMVKLGAKVMLVARGETALKEAADELSQYGEVAYIAQDITEAGAGEIIVEAVIKAFGRLYILVNNAGSSFAENFEDVERSDWEQDIDLKVMSAVNMSKAALPHLKKQGGAVLNLTAVMGKTPQPNSLPTTVSRCAGLALTRAISNDLGKYKSGVQGVSLGLIRIHQVEKRCQKQAPDLSWEEFSARKGEKIPLARIGNTAEATNVIIFLCSYLASYVSGTA